MQFINTSVLGKLVVAAVLTVAASTALAQASKAPAANTAATQAALDALVKAAKAEGEIRFYTAATSLRHVMAAEQCSSKR